MRPSRLLILALCAAPAACRSSSAPPPSPSAAASAALAPGAKSIKIWVAATGAIELDGKPSDMQTIEALLPELAKRDGAVVYYGRDAAGGEPPPDAMKIVKLVVANKLPIRMSSTKDFSKTMDFERAFH
jgi:ABC-type glycerol-3-phosphate transport system substrate-binding protein